MGSTAPPLLPAEQLVSDFLADLTSLEAIEVGFNCFLTHRPDISRANEENSKEEFLKIIRSIQAENPANVDAALKYFVSQTAANSNCKKQEQLFDILHHAVGHHVLTAQQVCDTILNSDKLVYTNGDHWVLSFNLVRKIVGGVNYKGVREIMKNCIEKASLLPTGINSGVTAQSESLRKLLEYIFDRDAALLPGYFIVNEILKSYPENKTWPHWSLVSLVSDFLNSFRPAAAMVSCTNKWRLLPVVEQLGRAHIVSTWKLEPATLKFLLKGSVTYERILPYSRDLTTPQPHLIKYLLSQPYSKELVTHVLGLQKGRKDVAPASGRCQPLEQQMVELLVEAMDMAEKGDHSEEILSDLFRNVASDLIFFVLFQFVSFPHVISELADHVETRRLKVGRDKLMWVLLQFISGSIAKNPTGDFLPVLRLYCMYDEPEPLDVPDTNSPSCVESLAATAIFIHLKKKAGGDNLRFAFSLPPALERHQEFLVSISKTPCSLNISAITYHVPLLCNTFSTTQELFQMPMSALVEAVGGSTGSSVTSSAHTAMPGTNCVAANPVQPLPMELLDSLSVHSKMSLIHSIVTHILKQVANKSTTALSPSIVETYSRLLVYSEIESLGIKGFLNQLLPKVFVQQSWGTLHTLLEIFSYRLYHIQAHYRLSLLTHLHQLATHNILNNHAQLQLTVESSALRLITGLGNSEISPPKNVPPTGAQKSTTLYGDSEELNRVVILTLARAVHIGGLEQNGSSWLKEVVSSIMANTPHSWPSHTTNNFPSVLAELVSETNVPKENIAQLKKCVEEEWRTWGAMTNENDIIQHFSSPQGNSLFLCLLWKMILETDDISPIAYKVLERIGAKQITSHLRSFCDFLVHEFSKSAGGGHVNKCIDAMNSMIWKYNIVTLDRLVLSMALRNHEGNEAQVCFFIIQLLLLKPSEFRNRVNEFCRVMSPDHHLLDDWHQKHLEIHTQFPEKFCPDALTEKQHFQTLPTYFGNVCLRFIPVFDIVVHRFLELPQVQKSLETLLDHLGCLYKFHDRPMTYLYNTLHYYETKLRDRAALRKKIVGSITDALKVVRPVGWGLTQEMTEKYLLTGGEDPGWKPGLDYYHRLVARMVAALDPTSNVFPRMDWRFKEFPNEGTHCLYVTCVELMTLPDKPSLVGEQLIDVILEGHSHIPPDKLPDWINSLGLILSNLPESYWVGLHSKIEAALLSPELANFSWSCEPGQLLDFTEIHNMQTSPGLAHLLAVVHSTWHHSGFNQLCAILDLLRDKLVKMVQTEEQMLFIFHMVGPFLQRLHTDRFMRILFEVTVQLYEILLRVDRSVEQLQHQDAVCDLLYHIKYQFTGDSVKGDAERVVRQLRSSLQLRLRFIAQVQLKTDAEMMMIKSGQSKMETDLGKQEVK